LKKKKPDLLNRDRPEGTGSKKNKTKRDGCLRFFCVLQVTVTLTAGGGRQGRRRRSRSTDFWSPSAAAREPTRRQ